MSDKQDDFLPSANINTRDGKILHYIRSNSTVLEFGSSYGRMTKYLKEVLGCKVYIVEIDREAYENSLQYAAAGVCADILDFTWANEFKDISFDHIILANVLEYLFDPEKVLEKSLSLLKDDGSVLLSAYNIAHSAVIINLINNKFEYENLGVLNKEHIRFFTHSSLSKMLDVNSLVPVVEDAVVILPENTEFKSNYGSLNGNTEILEEKEYANVYQFVFKCVKKRCYLENKDVCVIQKLYENKTSSSCIIYFDTGSDFNPYEFTTRPVYKNKKHHFEVDVTLSPDVKRIRFDPFEGYACIIDNLQILTDKGVIEYAYTNGMASGGVFLFDTIDPQIIIDFNGRIFQQVKISYNAYKFNFDDIPLLFKIKSKTIDLVAEKENMQASISWRITKPLRMIARFLRKK
ncbi:MAG: class I SAM-dependent methyltransferase [Spirochaetaceae bacterium]|nr:class I SAM-dependent methyltransferase [Spirochaetaceae bacterium]